MEEPEAKPAGRPSEEHRHEAYFPKDATPLAYEDKTIYDYLFGQPDFNPSLPAFNYLDTRISYGKLKEERIRAISLLLHAALKANAGILKILLLKGTAKDEA